MRKIIFLFKEYFNDLENLSNTDTKIIKPGKIIFSLTYCIVGFLFTLFLVAVVCGYVNNRIIYWLEYIKIILAILFVYILLYIGLLASHIVLSDSIEYVQYFIKRRKIKLCDIKECQTIYLNGVAKTLRIISKDEITFIDINYSFFNSLEDLKKFATSIGFPDAIQYKEKRVLTESEKKKKKQERKKSVKKILNGLISIFLIAYITPVLLFTLSYYLEINGKITKIILFLPIVIGWKLSPFFWKKTKKYSLRKMIILGILSIIIYCLIFFISGSLYSYLRFGHI